MKTKVSYLDSKATVKNVEIVEVGNKWKRSNTFLKKSDEECSSEDFRPRLISQRKLSTFTLKDSSESKVYQFEKWVHRLSILPEVSDKVAPMPAAQLKLDLTDDSVEHPIRHFERTWQLKTHRKSEMRMSLIRLNDKNWLEKVLASIITYKIKFTIVSLFCSIATIWMLFQVSKLMMMSSLTAVLTLKRNLNMLTKKLN